MERTPNRFFSIMGKAAIVAVCFVVSYTLLFLISAATGSRGDVYGGPVWVLVFTYLISKPILTSLWSESSGLRKATAIAAGVIVGLTIFSLGSPLLGLAWLKILGLAHAHLVPIAVLGVALLAAITSRKITRKVLA